MNDASEAGASVNAASVFGRLPVRLSEREYGRLDVHTTCFAYGIATWCFLTGAYAAELVGAVQGTVCLIAGNLVGVFLAAMPTALGCQRYGLEQMDYCKTAFGQHGAHIILVFYLINMLGWSGLLLVMFGNGIFNIAGTFNAQPGDWLVGAGVALGIWLSFLVTVKGVHRIATFNNWVTPALGTVVLFMAWTLFRTYGWNAIAAAPPLDPGPDPLVNYAIVLELGIANGFSWWGGIGFIARNSRTRRDSVYAQVIHLGISSAAVSCVALYAALVVGSDDPTRWMVPLGGVLLGIVALVFVTLANITSVAVSIFAAGLALRHVPALRQRRWWQILVLTLVPCAFFVVWPQELYDMGSAFLAYNGTMYAPICGVLFVDFFLLRGQRICLRSVFDNAPQGAYHYFKGFNVLGLACVAIGQATYFLLYNPFSGETHALFIYLPASMASFLVPAIAYYAGMRWYGVRVSSSAPAGPLSQPNL